MLLDLRFALLAICVPAQVATALPQVSVGARVPAAPAVRPPTFVLQRLVGTGDPMPGGGTFAECNTPCLHQGRILFYGVGNGVRGIYEYAAGAVTTVVDSQTQIPNMPAGWPFAWLGGFALRDDEIAFVGMNPSGYGGLHHIGSAMPATIAWGTSWGAGTNVPGTSATFYPWGFGPPSVSAHGVVLLSAGPNGSYAGCYTNQGGGLRVVADGNTLVPGGSGTFTNTQGQGGNAVPPSIDGNSIWFWGAYNGGEGIFEDVDAVQSPVVGSTTPAPDGSTFAHFFALAAADGDLLFQANTTANPGAFGGPFGVYLRRGGVVTTVVDAGPTFGVSRVDGIAVGGGTAIVNGGSTALGGALAIFDYSGGALHTVCTTTAQLEGRNMLHFGTTRGAVDGDRCVFAVQFDVASSYAQSVYLARRIP